MEKILETLLSTGNVAAVAVIVTTVYFLKEIRVQRREYFEESAARLAALKEISAKHDETFKKCSEKLDAALERNTVMLSRADVALERCEQERRAVA